MFFFFIEAPKRNIVVKNDTVQAICHIKVTIRSQNTEKHLIQHIFFLFCNNLYHHWKILLIILMKNSGTLCAQVVWLCLGRTSGHLLVLCAHEWYFYFWLTLKGFNIRTIKIRSLFFYLKYSCRSCINYKIDILTSRLT